MSKTSELVVTNYQLPSLNETFTAALGEEMDGLTISFDRAKIPSGGGLALEIPSDDPDSPDLARELSGVIVDHYPLNSYWRNKYNGQNSIPDCFSMDGRTGRGDPGGDCKKCPLNQFGSDENNAGKACKNAHRLYILRSGEIFPICLTLPPTSIKTFSDYLAKRIVTKGLRSYGVVTKITLKKATNATGITYSQAQFAVEEKLSAEATETMLAFSDNIKLITRKVEETTDFIDAADGTSTEN